MKTIITLIALIIGFVILAHPVSAFDVLEDPCKAAPQSATCKSIAQQKTEDRIVGPNGILTKIAQVIVFIAGAASVVVVTIAGAKYAFANGDSNSIASAKDTILYALIGLMVTIFSQLIVSFVLTRL